MSGLRAAAWLLLALVLPSTQPVPTPGDGLPCPKWRDDDAHMLNQLEARLVELVNAARTREGSAPLVPDERLVRLARQHSQRMADAGRLAHLLDDEVDLAARLRATGMLDWDRVGENIAVGPVVSSRTESLSSHVRSTRCHDVQSLAAELFAAWDASPAHSRNLRSSEFSHVGSGAAYDARRERVYVTHDFAREVQCGYLGAPCCPAPPGETGGMCLLPGRCRGGLCLEPLPVPTPSPSPR